MHHAINNRIIDTDLSSQMSVIRLRVGSLILECDFKPRRSDSLAGGPHAWAYLDGCGSWHSVRVHPASESTLSRGRQVASSYSSHLCLYSTLYTVEVKEVTRRIFLIHACCIF